MTDNAPPPQLGTVDAHADIPIDTLPLQDPWPAPLVRQPLHSMVRIPGSKSLSNRFLVLAALGSRNVELRGLLRSRDTELMMMALKALGVGFQVDPHDDTTVTVTPPAGGHFTGNVSVYCGLAGTVMRFVPALALFAQGPVGFDGDGRSHQRPMKPLLDGLEQLGARIEYHGREGFLPFTLWPTSAIERQGGRESTGPAEVSIDSSASSQFVSGLLLIGSRLSGGLHLVHTGGAVPSTPHIRMTIADIANAGGSVNMSGNMVWEVAHSALNLPDKVLIEPDLSNAAPFLGAALIAGGSVSVPHWSSQTTQPGGLLPGILKAMGASVSIDGSEHFMTGSGTFTVESKGSIHGLGVFDLAAAGEMAPSISALAVFADSPTVLGGIGHLRGHETNRLAALVSEIRRIGGIAKEFDDGLEIVPVPRQSLHGATMQTYADHRMATFAAMVGLAVPDISIVDVATTGKTIPNFTGMWESMLRSQ